MATDTNGVLGFGAASLLNDRVTKLFVMLADDLSGDAGETFLFKSKGTSDAINKCYGLLVNELEKIYSSNTQLSALNEVPATTAIWKHFLTIDNNAIGIQEFSSTRKLDESFNHNALVKRLAIIHDDENPQIQPQLQKVLDYADKVLDDLSKHLGNIKNRKPRRYRSEYHIAEYRLEYKEDGNMVINGVLKLKKTQSGSAPRKLMEQAVKRPYELFHPELGKINRNIISILADMGISGTLKELFFPIVGTDGIKFRPYVTSDTAFEEGIDFSALETQLINLGASMQHILETTLDKTPLDTEALTLLNESGILIDPTIDETERK